MVPKTLLAIAVAVAINENSRKALELTVEAKPSGPSAMSGRPLPASGISLRELFCRFPPGLNAYPQNSRPIRQPHCSRQAHARQREKAEARELANGV